MAHSKERKELIKKAAERLMVRVSEDRPVDWNRVNSLIEDIHRANDKKEEYLDALAKKMNRR